MKTQGAGRTTGKDAAAVRRLMEHIRLLCHSGAGLAAIAGPICYAARDLLLAASAALFWIDELGVPAGYFHDCAPSDLKDFFVTHFDELFGTPDQISMLTFIGGNGEAIGTTLADGFMDRWLQGNIHLYLCVPLGHHHLLDMRIEKDGRGCAALFVWNPEERPFTRRDAEQWRPVRVLLEHAARADASQVTWQQVGDGHGHFITDLSGRSLIAIHPEAETFLADSHLLKQNIGVTGQMEQAPLFAQMLAGQLAAGLPATIDLPVANGRLVARASRTRAVGGANADTAMMYVSLHREVAQNVLAVEHLMALPLTPFQREIALFAMTGGARGDCGTEFGVSDEALKKHLRAIFAATGTTRWADLSAMRLPAT